MRPKDKPQPNPDIITLTVRSKNPLVKLSPTQRTALDLVNLISSISERQSVDSGIQLLTSLSLNPQLLQHLTAAAYRYPGLFTEPNPNLGVTPSLRDIRFRFPTITSHFAGPMIIPLLADHPAVTERVTTQLTQIQAAAPDQGVNTIDILLTELLETAELPVNDETLARLIQDHQVYESIVDHLETENVFRALTYDEKSSFIYLGQRLGRPARLLRANLEEGFEKAPSDQKHAEGIDSQLRVLRYFTSALAESDDPEDRDRLSNIREMMKALSTELDQTNHRLRHSEHPGAPEFSRAEQLHHWWE